jgi:carbon monoxide dehydrogenase subunit G
VKLEQSFEVAAPIERVWNALIDIEYVAPCLPGANITGRDEDGSYRGTFSVKLGPTTAAYNGVLKIEDADEAAHRATLHARGTDKRGQGGANATIINTVTEVSPGTTRVDASTDFTITGRLARFGRGGMIEDISNRLLRDFSECLAGKLLADEAASAEASTAGGAPPPGTTAEAPPAPGATTGAATGARASGAAAAGTPVPGAPAPAPGAAAAPAAAAGAGASAATGPATSSGPAPTQTPKPTPAPSAAAPQAAKPVGGFSLFFSVLWERIRRFVRGDRRAR